VLPTRLRQSHWHRKILYFGFLADLSPESASMIEIRCFFYIEVRMDYPEATALTKYDLAGHGTFAFTRQVRCFKGMSDLRGFFANGAVSFRHMLLFDTL